MIRLINSNGLIIVQSIVVLWWFIRSVYVFKIAKPNQKFHLMYWTKIQLNVNWINTSKRIFRTISPGRDNQNSGIKEKTKNRWKMNLISPTIYPKCSQFLYFSHIDNRHIYNLMLGAGVLFSSMFHSTQIFWGAFYNIWYFTIANEQKQKKKKQQHLCGSHPFWSSQ